MVNRKTLNTSARVPICSEEETLMKQVWCKNMVEGLAFQQI